jgi:trigger factor
MRQLPSLDDALAKSLGVEGVETLDALRDRIGKDLEKRESRRAETELKDALVKAALEKNEFEVPPSMVERAVDTMIEGAAERFARSGIDIQQLGLDYGRMRADLRDQALLQVRGRLLLDAIADTEKIEVTDEDLQAEIARLADEMGLSLVKVQQQMKGGDAREALRNKIREDKALALMTSAATITNA